MTNDFINRKHLSTQDKFKYEIPGLYISVGIDNRNNQYYIYFKTKEKESLEYIGEEL